MTYEEFRSLVKNMRMTQKKYFASRDYALMEKARQLEREVDVELKKQPGQMELFGAE